MEDLIKFSVNNFGLIDNVNLDLGKLTVVGGHNSTGKSTVAKLLFSFLKYNSSKRKELVYEDIINQITKFLFKLNEYSKVDGGEFSFNDFFEYFTKLNDNSFDYESKLEIYNNLKKIYFSIEFNDSIKSELDEIILEIDELSDIVNIDNSSLYNSVMRKLLKSEFSGKNFTGSAKLDGIYKEIPFEFSFDFSKNDFNSDNSFKHVGLFSLPDVFYIDSVSLIDLKDNFGLQNTDHTKFLSNSLDAFEDESFKLFDEKRYEKHMEIESEIEKVIGGRIQYDGNNFIYIDNKGKQFFMKDTASGIKQIGIIQLLLSYRKLKENSFLIIDEPEVNLHPDWIFKLAYILVLLSKSLNISIYINSHSPMFIEAIEVFSEYYDLKDDAYYYLTQVCESNDLKFTFKYIHSDDLHIIYDNLAKPYLDIERYKIENRINKNNF